MHCPTCGKDEHPTIDLSPEGRAVFVCVPCSTPIGPVNPKALPAPLAAPVSAAPTPLGAGFMPRPTTPILAPGETQLYSANETTSPQPSALERTRSELAAKEAELARYGALKLEVRQLRAMVKAAERLERKKNVPAAGGGVGGGAASGTGGLSVLYVADGAPFQPPAGATRVYGVGGGGAGGSINEMTPPIAMAGE